MLQDIKNPKEWIKLTTPGYELDDESSKSSWIKSGKKFLEETYQSWWFMNSKTSSRFAFAFTSVYA
jgi:hypothetical protein